MPETLTKRVESNKVVLSAAYFPPIEFFAIMAENSVVYLDAFEHYQKQSWRNRCRILTASGPMELRVPVVHVRDLYHTAVKDVPVDYSTPWLSQTKYAIDTAYYSSPFFEYYRDGLFSILDSKLPTLWELDFALIEFFRSRLGIATSLASTSEYIGADVVLHPKLHSSYSSRPYWQVFRERFGFVGGLSVMDLLFNEGPESICYL